MKKDRIFDEKHLYGCNFCHKRQVLSEMYKDLIAVRGRIGWPCLKCAEKEGWLNFGIKNKRQE